MYGHHKTREEEERERRMHEAQQHHHTPTPPPPVVHHQPPPPVVHHQPPPPVHQPPPPQPHHQTPHAPSHPTVQHVSHQVTPGHSTSAHTAPSHGASSNQKTVRVFPKAGEGFALTIRNGQVVLAKANPKDEHQHWIKDEKYSTKVKDKEGQPSFALVNKVTGEAIKHSVGQEHPVRLVHYKPDYLDESVLWTESKDSKDGFRSIRMVNNINLAFDAFHGDKDHGGVHDGTTVVLWESWKGDNQIWKIVPY